MNLKQYYILLSLTCLLKTHITYSSGRDTNVCSNIIAGNQVQGSDQSANCGSASDGGLLESAKDLLNSFKDRVDWTMQNYESTELGAINNPHKINVRYPSVGKMRHFSFIPTEGNMKNKKIELLFVSFSIHGKTNNITVPEAVKNQLAQLKTNKSPFKNIVKVYRKLEGESQWLEFGELYTSTNPDAKKLEVSFNILPNGTAEASEKLYRTDIDGNTMEYESNKFDLSVLL